jgi:hypothetical protein
MLNWKTELEFNHVTPDDAKRVLSVRSSFRSLVCCTNLPQKSALSGAMACKLFLFFSAIGLCVEKKIKCACKSCG